MVVIPVQPRATKTSTLKEIGKLSFTRDDQLGVGSFGTVYRGKYKNKDVIDVAVKRILKEKVTSDFETTFLAKIASHPNILRYYHKEEDEDFV